MNKMKDFDNILDECLGRLLEGEGVEACLSRYPEHATELEPLLRTAYNTLTTTDIRPHPEFRDRARYQFQAAIREMPVKEKRDFFGVLRPALATVVMLAVVLLVGGSVVVAAGNSLPGSPLYSVKLATETVRLALTPSDLGKAELNAGFADERIDEIVRLAQNGDATLIEDTTERMNRQLMAVAILTGAGGDTSKSAYLDAMDAPLPTSAPTMTPASLPASSPSATGKTMTPAPTPPTMVVPTPTITTPPEGLLSAGQAEDGIPGEREAQDTNGGDGQARLRDTLLRQYSENIKALMEELDKAPESLKPALQYAIEVAQNAYSEALESLSG